MKIPKGKPWPKALMQPGETFNRRETEAKNFVRIVRSHLRGINILFDHYEIQKAPDGAQFALLCFALARDIFPYFQLDAVPSGRPKRWTRDTKVGLWILVELERRARRCTIEQACENLSRGPYKRYQADTILTRYKEAKKLARESFGDADIFGGWPFSGRLESAVQKTV